MKRVFGNKVDKVIVSNSLLDYPFSIVTSQYCMAQNKERIIVRLLVEINPDHQIIINMRKKVKDNPYDKSVKYWVNWMFQNSLKSSGLIEVQPNELKSAHFANLDHEVINLAFLVSNKILINIIKFLSRSKKPTSQSACSCEKSR
jgi:molecular chaperone HtpG